MSVNNVTALVAALQQLIDQVIKEPPKTTPSSYVTLWLIGVVLSCILIVAMLVWTIFQSRLRALAAGSKTRSRLRRRQCCLRARASSSLGADFDTSAIALSYEPPRDPLITAEATPSTSTTTTTEAPAIASLAAANLKMESLKIDFDDLCLTLRK